MSASTYKIETKKSKRSKKNPGKVRVKLPGIESYEKELEFTAEGPGRVIVRLERLMGSDKIRITDPKYLATLVERLEAEETQAWTTRSRLRKKGEKNRSRQMAIEGLMEPAEDMLDLLNHPVFRVNRILNRLAVFDTNMTLPGGSDRLPPIVQVEPFIEDESGSIFKSYPGHTIFYHKELPFSRLSFKPKSSSSMSPTTSQPKSINQTEKKSIAPASVEPGSVSPQPMEREERLASIRPSVAKFDNPEDELEVGEEGEGMPASIYRQGPPAPVRDEEEGKERPIGEEPEGEEEGGEISQGVGQQLDTQKEELVFEQQGDLEAGGSEKADDGKEMGLDVSLHALQKRYGIPSYENLLAQYEEYRAELVNRIYEDQNPNVEDIYSMANDVMGVYLRQQLVTDDYVVSHGPNPALYEDSKEELLEDERIAAEIAEVAELMANKEAAAGGTIPVRGRTLKCKERKVRKEREGEEDESNEEEGEEEDEDEEEDDDEEDCVWVDDIEPIVETTIAEAEEVVEELSMNEEDVPEEEMEEIKVEPSKRSVVEPTGEIAEDNIFNSLIFSDEDQAPEE